jgi:hypothetical protein
MKSKRWTARLEGTLQSVDAIRDDINKTIVLRFYIPSSVKFIIGDLPDWDIDYDEDQVTRSFGDMCGIIKDTLMDSEPKLRLSYQCYNSSRSTTRARLVDIVWGGEAVVHNGDKTHYLHLVIRLEKDESLPESVSDCHMIISGHPLPEDRFRYGYCDRFSKGDRSCTFGTYLECAWKYGSNKAVGREGEVCRAFVLEKGSIQQYCNFAT